MKLLPFRSRSRSRSRGAASVEAVVVLPIFLLLFISVFYVRHQALAKQAAQERARTCAWLYSANNCEFDPSLMPAECDSAMTKAPFASAAAKAVTDKLTGDGFFHDVVNKMLDSALETVFGDAIDVKVERKVARPVLYGGDTQAVAGEYHLACNLKPKDKIDIATEAWSHVNPFK
jgi:hypothetical protein